MQGAESCKPERMSRSVTSSRQQQLQILPAQAGHHALVGLHDGVGQGSFPGLELQDLLFYGVAGDQAVGEDGPRLADAVGAVDGLGFDRGIPPGIEEVDVVGGGRLRPSPPAFRLIRKSALPASDWNLSTSSWRLRVLPSRY